MKKILIYSHDAFGLGNIRRMLAIAKYLSGAGYSILILSGSPMLHAFRIGAGIDYIKLPCLGRDCEGDYSVCTLAMDYDAISRLRANLIRSTVEDFQPDLILVDKKPLGLSDELAPALDALRHRIRPPKVVLLLRDILDSAQATIQAWQENGYHDTIEQFYDMILVVGTPEIFNVATEYKFPHFSRSLVRYCGYVGRDKGHLSSTRLRDKLNVDGRPLVLVTAGGGGDGYRLITSYLEGLCLGKGALPEECYSLILCGSEMPKPYRDEVKKLANDCPQVQVEEFTDDMMSYMEASDLVVSMGGYNTVCEILTLNKRSVIVPRAHPVQEQWIRCSRLSDRGMLRAIHPDHLSPGALMQMVSEELQQARSCDVPEHGLKLDGLPRIGEWIDQLLEEKPLPEPTEVFSQGVSRAPVLHMDRYVRTPQGMNYERAKSFL